MSASIDLLRKLGAARPAESVPDAKVTPALPHADEEECETPAYGYLRGIRDRALNIEFRRTTKGDELSFPYAWLGPTRHHPSIGVQLLFAGAESYLVTLWGRNLRSVEGGMSLYDRGILRHRVTWVREATPEESRRLGDSICIVERIEVRVVTEEEAARVFAETGAA